MTPSSDKGQERAPRRPCAYRVTMGSCACITLEGLYPCGEGAGYAGGIVIGCN